MIKKITIFFSALIIGKELYFCIFDKILHTTLFLSILFVICTWTGLKYKLEDDVLYNRISIGCAITWGVFAIFTVGYAPKYFESAEPISGSIGYVLVKVFNKDLAFISNSRDECNIKPFDYYLVDVGDGETALLEYFRKKVSPEVNCRNQGEGIIYYIDGAGYEEGALVSVLEKEGYDILRVEATRQFKQKNIFGEYYKGKNIYAR